MKGVSLPLTLGLVTMENQLVSRCKLLQECDVSQYGVLECSQYPVQKPVEKCASLPRQTCVRSRLKHKCKNVTQNVCRKILLSPSLVTFLTRLSPSPPDNTKQ